MLVGLAEPFMAPATDCLGGRTFAVRVEGGPMEGRAARRPDNEGFRAVEEVVLCGVELPDDVVEARCFAGDLFGDWVAVSGLVIGCPDASNIVPSIPFHRSVP